jgi:acetoin utilization deacetylase AcuC-like enzyme
MKLIRFGAPGAEKPGLVLGDGARVDASSFGSDWDEPFFGSDGLVRLAEWARAADALVLALGVDAAEDDPTSPLRVTEDGFREAGRVLGALSLPVVVVQEGGYDLDALGSLVLAALEGVEEGSA